MSQVTVKEAGLLTGKSRETINTATRSGKLSSSRNSKNTKVIEISELERVYKLVKTIEQVRSKSETVKVDRESSGSDVRSELAVLREKFASSELMKESIVAERERERRQFESEIENLRASMEKVQEQHSKALLLITDQSNQTTDRVGDWEKSIQALEERIANNEKKSQQEREESKLAKRKAQQYKRALAEEQSKSLWQKLFG